MNAFTRTFDHALDAIQSVFMSILTKIGPFTVALMPASFTAYAIYHTFEASAGSRLALFFALVVGTAWETVGIVACHTAIDLYNAAENKRIQPIKFWLMLALIPVYVLGVAGVVYFSQDAFVPLVKGLGVASPFLTTITYTAVALARDIRKIEAQQEQVEDKQAQREAEDRQRQAEIERQEREWQREKERLELEQKHVERLAQIEAKSLSRTVSTVSQDDTAKGSKMSQAEIMERILRYLETNGDTALTHLAEQLGISRSTLYRRIDDLQQAGRLHKNGDGWEVLR